MSAQATGSGTVRLFGLLRMGWGTVLVATPRPVLLLVPGGHDTGQVERRVAQLLGGREIVQGVLTALFPTRRTLWWGAGVDAIHATSMLALALLPQSSRSAALSSATIAGTECAIGAVMARARRP